ncbi:cytochrome c peroxidase [Pacificibacter maritimus]|uniref:Cytochrome c peroxidase n=1 Tax=Pacificibacter maritimus TaxID=762213 RepID=A0A3N4VCW7_9RHOB|nr:cytochrome c peroxidase [Pacificibacter maritimus]RPE71690.1 cytochrome c peroxidase [Pacificibacter maritimus]
MTSIFKTALMHAVLLGSVTSMPVEAQTLPAAITDDLYRAVHLHEAELGQLLFYDPILSGNMTTACVSCHHPKLGTSDGVSLSFGDGGIGMGTKRQADPQNLPEERIPRNAPALFNLGALEFTSMFHDGRLEVAADHPSGIRTPMGADIIDGFASVLSAQTMFPVLSRDEMAGSFRENEIGRLVRQGIISGEGGAWHVLARRVAEIPGYADAFVQVYPHINSADDIGFTDISNALAAFMEFEWRSDTAPFDAVLRGDLTLQGDEKAGLDLFYGKANCADCHAGPFLTDHQFHVMAAPQIGPGKSEPFETHNRDDGRFRVTGIESDRYAFRTPSLRNVALTGPYGHAGAHRDLAHFVADHADPAARLASYDRSQAVLPAFDGHDFNIMDAQDQRDAIAAAVTAEPVALADHEVAQIVAFLQLLTDPISKAGRLGSPETVPSGLPVPLVD